MEVPDKKEKDKVSGLLFIGFMFVGLGIGFHLQEIPAGVIGGMGMGFLAAALYRITKK